jgi:hypothetical protein
MTASCTKKAEDPLVSDIRFGNQDLRFNRLAWNNLGSYLQNTFKHKFVLLDNNFNYTNDQFRGTGNLVELTFLTSSESMPGGIYHFAEQETSPSLFNGYIALNYNAQLQTAQTMAVVKGGMINASTDNAQGATWIRLDIRLLTHTGDSLEGTFYGPLITQEIPKINQHN